jgi:hypothetical protein
MSMVRQIKAGTTDVSVVIRIVDSTDGTPETGVVFDTAGIDLEYRRELAASTDITEATLAALTTAHTDGGFLHIGNGYYRLDLPDAACADGVPGVLVHGTVTGMVVIGTYIELVDYDPYDGVRLGLTGLPAALVGGRIDASVGAMAANTVTASALAADAGAEIADAVLDRDMATGTDSGSTTVRTARQALRAIRNKVSIAAGTLTVTKEDDSTASWTAAVTTAAGNPISAVDPAGP